MAISATSSVLTANDWQYAKDIKPGDYVFNQLGQPVKVKTVQTYRSEDCYRVTFDDYLSIDGDLHLAFPIEDRQYRKRALAYRGRLQRYAKLKIINVQSLCELDLTHRGNRSTYSVPTTEPVQLPHQPLGIPPFVYGLWFAGRMSRRQIHIPYEFLDDAIEKLTNAGYKVTKTGPYRQKYERIRTEPSIWDQLRGLQTRKIPIQYLYSSAEQRLELIQGLLSAKPCKKTGSTGLFCIKTRKKHISAAIQYLSESLGAKTIPTEDKITGTYDLRIFRITPFIEQMAQKRAAAHLARRYVKSIKPISAQLCVHIETDEKDGTFLVGEGFIPCH